MIWTRIEIESWTFGIDFETCLTLNFGPIKVSWVRKGSSLYRDFRRIRNTPRED